MIDLRLLKTFMTVLETGTYSQAAVELDYAHGRGPCASALRGTDLAAV